MLESAGFDFRVRVPHKQVAKLAIYYKLDASVGRVAFDVCSDMYKTFAPLKHGSFPVAYACIELAARITGAKFEPKTTASGDILITMNNKDKFTIARAAVMELLLDLVELYTHHTKSTLVGSQHDVNVFIQLRIALNKESQEKGLARYTHWSEKSNGIKLKTPKTPITPASPSAPILPNGRDLVSPDAQSPTTGPGRKGAGARGSDGTIRFMLDGERAKQENISVSEYHKVEYEEYEVEVEEKVVVAPRHDRDRPYGGHRGGFGGRRGGRR